MSWSIPGYTATRPLGLGAAVWAGLEAATGEPVALRRVAVAASPGAGWLAAEGERVARFRHPHAVPVRAVLSSGSELVVVSDLAGHDLATLRGAGRLRSGQVAAVFVPLAHALAAAHDAGLGHGALGPGSVLFGASGDPLLAGIGVARLAAGPDEQHNPSADVYALAAVAAQTLTGRPVPESGDGVQRWADHAHTLGVPTLVAVAICAALSPVPRHRPTAEAFAELLYAGVAPEPVEFAAGPPLEATAGVVTPDAERGPDGVRGPRGECGAAVGARVLPGGPPVAAAGSTSAERWAAVRAAAARPRRGKVRAVVVAVVLAVVAGAGLLWIGHDAVSQPSAVPSPSPAANWPAVVGQLDSNRATAFSRADPSLLGAVYATGSAPLAADARAISGLRAQGAVAEGVRHDVRRVQVIAASATTADLEVTDRMGTYRVLGHAGAVLRQVPAGSDRRVRIVLLAFGGHWLISAVSRAEAAP
ncbi:MAG: serine/threonine kinase PknH [Cryptosporangiaceae bacterium]|nr:serine/threonine kinase PknH [Cryptosporangiaceae bacterium]